LPPVVGGVIGGMGGVGGGAGATEAGGRPNNLFIQ